MCYIILNCLYNKGLIIKYCFMRGILASLILIILSSTSCTETILEVPKITGSWMLESSDNAAKEIISFTDDMTYEIATFPGQIENPIGSQVDTIYITGEYARLGNQVTFLSANFKMKDQAEIVYAQPTIYGASVSTIFVGIVNTVVAVYNFIEFIPAGLTLVFNPFLWTIDRISKDTLILNDGDKLCRYKRL